MEILLKDLLKKYTQFIPKEEKVRNILIPLLEDKYNITLQKEDVSLIQGRLFISGSPHVKGVLYRNKDRILSDVQSLLDVHLKDLR